MKTKNKHVECIYVKGFKKHTHKQNQMNEIECGTEGNRIIVFIVIETLWFWIMQ